MRLHAILLAVLVIGYASIIGPFTRYLKERPVQQKVGYIPRPAVLKFMVADQKELAAAALVLKSMIYYGGVLDPKLNKLNLAPDFPGMYDALTVALRLDPYNMDAYYFCQAFMAWDVGEIRAANSVLEYGMKYRTWDFYLPLFAGFNYAYFLKDYEKAAFYYRRAGELSGSELYISLTGRYLYEAGKTGLAIDFLELMIKGTRNESIRRNLGIRLLALQDIKKIEDSERAYSLKYKKLPKSIQQIVDEGFLDAVPRDPYGGIFFLDQKGQVRTTSNLAFKRKRQ